MTLMPETTDDGTDDEPKEYADRFDGVTLDCEHVRATVEYTVDLSEFDSDETHERTTDREFATRVAVSRAEQEFDLTFTIDQTDAVAQPNDPHIRSQDDVWTVLVRIDQNQ